MQASYVFACLPVGDLDAAVAWYGRLLGRAPTFVPNAVEAVWQLAATASLYVLADRERAGRGVVTIAVGDLKAAVAEIAARGIAMGSVEEIPGAGCKARVRDPDGNELALVEIRGGSAGAVRGPHAG